MPRRFGGAGCRYLLDQRTGGKRNDPGQCGAKEQPGSAYCPEHHALCYLPRSSVLEGHRLRQIDRIGELVGGRQGANTAAALRKLMLKVAAIEGHA